MERRAGSFCVLVDGDNEAATTRDRIAKVGVRDGSVRDDPIVLPELTSETLVWIALTLIAIIYTF